MQAASFMRLTALLAVLALFLPSLAAAQSSASPNGWWLDATGKAGILISPCGGKLCGKIEWLRQPLDAAGKPKTDIHNPDASLRPRRLCGLPTLGNFTPNADGSWGGGWVYDPSIGKTYKSNMHVAPDGTLHVRGYIGVPLIGRSVIMTRPAAALQPCVPG